MRNLPHHLLGSISPSHSLHGCQGCGVLATISRHENRDSCHFCHESFPHIIKSRADSHPSVVLKKTEKYVKLSGDTGMEWIRAVHSCWLSSCFHPVCVCVCTCKYTWYMCGGQRTTLRVGPLKPFPTSYDAESFIGLELGHVDLAS